ncbi:UPF0746 protein DDB_G0281095-like [Patiria miniata]|uniref:Uncharacterized protein n=1 Tax=Patiria miniata TaxID=46514 RepID=A0A914AHK4_PATMI|nr:UPF0746 protein DDB_G0281095-like [Patiria miniata]
MESNTNACSVTMIWDNQKEQILISEVILARPFQYRQGTRERGRAWQEVADAMRASNFKVDKRAVQDRMTSLMERVKAKNKRETAASGIAVEETDEERKIRECVEDMLQEEEDIESAHQKEKGGEEKKKADGAEMRKRACETYRETQKRVVTAVSHQKRRNSGSETISLIQRKMEMDQTMRREEMLRRAEEEERRRGEEREKERRFEFLQQQQQFQQQMQQQQQQFQQQQQQMQHQLLQQNQQSQTIMMGLLKALEKRD